MNNNINNNSNSNSLQSGIQSNSNSNNELGTPLYVQKEIKEIADTTNTISLNQMKQHNLQSAKHYGHINKSSESTFTSTSTSNNHEQTRLNDEFTKSNNEQESLNVKKSINFITQTNNLGQNTHQNQNEFNLSSDNFSEKLISENEKSADLRENKKSELYDIKTKKIEHNKISTEPKNDPLLKKILKGCLLKLFKYLGCLLFIISITIIIILYIINF